MDMILYIIILLITLIVILFHIFNFILSRKEHFSFAPYDGNKAFDFKDYRECDRALLSKKLAEWETPFNNHNEGYIRAY